MKNLHYETNEFKKISFSSDEYLGFSDFFYYWFRLKDLSIFNILFQERNIDRLIINSWIHELKASLLTNDYSESFVELNEFIREVSSTISRSLMENNGWSYWQYNKIKPYFKYEKNEGDGHTIYLPLKYISYLSKALALFKNIINFEFENCLLTFDFMFTKTDRKKIEKCFEMVHKHSGGVKKTFENIFAVYEQKMEIFL